MLTEACALVVCTTTGAGVGLLAAEVKPARMSSRSWSIFLFFFWFSLEFKTVLFGNGREMPSGAAGAAAAGVMAGEGGERRRKGGKRKKRNVGRF